MNRSRKFISFLEQEKEPKVPKEGYTHWIHPEEDGAYCGVIDDKDNTTFATAKDISKVDCPACLKKARKGGVAEAEEEETPKGFYSRYTSDFKIGDKVELEDGTKGEVVIVTGRYVEVVDDDGVPHVTIPGHGELKKVDEG